MPRVPRLLRTAAQTLLTTLLVLAAAFLLVPRLAGWPVETVLSGSMEPGTPVGSVVVVEPVGADKVEPGDVITFTDEGRLVTHRVLEANGDGAARSFVTKGDANEDPDTDRVPASALRGRVRFTVPYLGYVGDELRRPVGRFLLLAVPVLLLAISGLGRLAGVRRGGSSPAGPEGPGQPEVTPR